jgi:melibiose permease/lactose/raffinose/galactose permease
MEDKKTMKRNLWMFPLGTVGRDMVYNLINSYLLTFVMLTRHLDPAQLAAITGIMIAARIFDALNDPLMGNIIERTRTKWGKFKPWLVIGILSTSVVIYLTFNVKLDGWPFVAFFGLMYFLYSITYTMHDISYWGMVPALSSDPDARNAYTSRANLFAGIGGTLAVALIPMLTAGSNAIGGSAVTAYGIIALAFAILAPAFLCFTIFGVKEQRTYSNEPVPPVSFKKIWNTIVKNDQLLWIALAFIIQQIGNGIILSGIGSMYIYFDFGYEGGYFTLFQMLGMIVTAFLMIFYPLISKKINRKPLMNILMIISTAGYAIMLLAGILLPTASAPIVKFALITFGYMLANFGQYGFYLIMMISIMNTVEYNEYKNGTRDEGIISSLRPFITKLASAIYAAIATGTFLVCGVINYTNEISDLERAASAGTITEADKIAQIGTVLSNVTHSETLGLLLFMTIPSAILMFVSFLIYKKNYKLDEAEYSRICGELEQRNAK